MASHSRSGGRAGVSLIALLASPLAAVACGDEIQNDYHNYYYGDGGAAEAEAGAPGAAGKPPMQRGGSDTGPSEGGGSGDGSGGGGEGGDGSDPYYPDAPIADTPVADFELDLFGTPGNRYWFGVSEQQLEAMNKGDQGGCPFCGGMYTPGDSGDAANYVDHLWVTTAGEEPRTADYGKVQVKIVGQSSRQPWDPNSIPNLNIDADQFVKNQRIAGYEHLRFSNGQVGSIFRDRVAYDLYRALDYPAPLVTYAWVQSNVWGPDISIPYLLVERYKQAFCQRNKTAFGGGCANIWEFASDFGYPQDGGGGVGGMGPKGPLPFPGGAVGGVFDAPENCQVDKCESGRANELEALMSATAHGEGFKVALKDYIDWPAYHRFQCLSWLVGTPDDQIHANNNVVVVEREDGLFQMLPYSVDISLNLWGGINLRGNNNLSVGCQADPACWEDTLDACEDLITDFKTIKPREMLKAVYDELDAQGMLRRGDAQQYQAIDAYLDDRLENATSELQQYRDGGAVCQLPYVECNGECFYGSCPDVCVPPGKPEPGPIFMEAGGAAAIGGAPAAGGAMGVGGGIVPPGGMGGSGPVECPKAADKYAVE
jgi:hypothetical protein